MPLNMTAPLIQHSLCISDPGFCATGQMRNGLFFCRSQDWHVQGLCVLEPCCRSVLRQAKVPVHRRGMSPYLPINASPAPFRSVNHGVQVFTAKGIHGLLWE